MKAIDPETVQRLREMREHLNAGWLGQRELWVKALDDVLDAVQQTATRSKE